MAKGQRIEFAATNGRSSNISPWFNAAWDSGTGRVLARAGFETSASGATAATNGRALELDVVAVRGCAALVVVSPGLPHPV